MMPKWEARIWKGNSEGAEKAKYEERRNTYKQTNLPISSSQKNEMMRILRNPRYFEIYVKSKIY